MTVDPGAGAGRIVVGVDGSQPSQQALPWGAHLAAVFGAASTP
jgi:nucleotide-binding universal stress UspA family protein